MRNVFIIANGQDTGGQSIRLVEAFHRRSAEWEARSMVASNTFIDYPTDLGWDPDELERRYAAADIIHGHNGTHAHDLYDRGRGRPLLVHWHGTTFRKHHAPLAARARRAGAVQVAATVDLEALERDVTWLPAPYNFDGPLVDWRWPRMPSFAELRRRNYVPAERIRIAHAPTNRGVKGTDVFLAAMRSLADRYDISLILIEGRPWDRCLARKAQADIFVDQLILGYGNNAIEAWGMGMPVVCGVLDPAVRRRMLELWGRLPFAEASADTLEAVLERLIVSAAMRREFAEIGTEHVRRFHDEARVVELLSGLYASAPPTARTPGGRADHLSRGETGQRARRIA